MSGRRYALWLIGTAVGTAILLLVCVGVGSVPLSAGEVLRALVIDDGSTARLLVWSLRLPRVLSAAMVGVCLSLAGCLLQGVCANHMASPSTIGVTSGASLAAHLTLVAFPGYAGLLPLGAMLGALGTTALIYALAYRRGASTLRLILSGMAVSALFGAVSDLVKLAFAERLGNAASFLVGGFNGCLWPSVARLAPWFIVGVALCALLPARLDLLALGDASARALGLRVEATRLVLTVLASAMAGAAVATAGMIGFVGLIVPHTARLMVGSGHRRLLPVAGILGGALVAVCDTLGRVILPAGEIPAGVVLALVGAPFFLVLLRQKEGVRD